MNAKDVVVGQLHRLTGPEKWIVRAVEVDGGLIEVELVKCDGKPKANEKVGSHLSVKARDLSPLDAVAASDGHKKSRKKQTKGGQKQRRIAKRNEATSSSLATLAKNIRHAHSEVVGTFRQTVGHAKKAGALLLKAKARLGHGKWLPWLTKRCKLAERKAQLYMQIARHR